MDTMKVVWQGIDGSLWSLHDPFSPVRLQSLAGLGLPSFTQQFATTGARDGRRYEGTTYNENTVTMTVVVGDDYVPKGMTGRRRGDAWRQLDAEWQGTFSPEDTGALIIGSGSGVRGLRLRLDEPTPASPRNAADLGKAVYTYDLTADDQPWWEGTAVTREFKWGVSTAEPFFGYPGGTKLLYISRASRTDAASITNPGDRPAWPRWWARGPFAGVSLGIAGRTVTLPFALALGETVYIDSLAQTITDAAGVSLWPRMGFIDPTFAPIPAATRGKPAEPVPLVVDISEPKAGAAVGVSLIPLYERPW